MIQYEFWQWKYQEIINLIETYHCNPSKRRIEEHLMVNYIKHVDCWENESSQNEDV